MNVASIKHLPDAPREELPSDLKGACRVMEEQFVKILLDSMQKAGVPGTSKGADGFRKDVTMSMFQGEIARIISEGDGLGLGKMLYEQLKPAEPVKSVNLDAVKEDKSILRPMKHLIG